MSEQIIEVEAESLEKAREQLKSQIPEGLQLLSERIISDGRPVAKTKQRIEVEAESLEKVRQQLRSQVPEGLQLLSETIISDGRPKTAKANADTTEEAFMKAEAETPKNAQVLEKKVLTPPERKIIAIEAFDEQTAHSNARSQARIRFGDAEAARSTKLAAVGKKGFLGIGRKPNRYESEILVRQASVEVSYVPKARIVAEVGDVHRPKARISAVVGHIEEAIARLITAFKDGSPDVRDDAVKALVKIGEPAISPLRDALKDSSTQVRRCAIHAIAKIEGIRTALPSVNDLFLNAMQDGDDGVREAASWALATLADKGNSRTIDCLIGAAIHDPSYHVRRAAVSALAKLGDARAVDPLTYVARNDADGVTRDWAAEALRTMSGQS